MKLWDPYADFKTEILPNGLRLCSAHWPRSWQRLEFVIHAGAREDPLGQLGLAHFLEHCVSENIPGWTHQEAEQFFESCGGRVDFGATCYDDTTYGFKLPAETVSLLSGLKIFGTMLLNAKIKKRVDEERLVIVREFHRKYTLPILYEWQLLEKRRIFGDHRLGTFVTAMDRPESLVNIKALNLQDFYDQYYVPANITVISLGGIGQDEIIDLLKLTPLGSDSRDGKRHSGFQSFDPGKTLPGVERRSMSQAFFKEKADVGTYATSVALPGGRRLLPGLLVLTEMLDELLFEAIRTKFNASYAFDSQYSNYHDAILLAIGGQVSPALVEKVGELVDDQILFAGQNQALFRRKRDSLVRTKYLTDVDGKEVVGAVSNSLSLFDQVISLAEMIEELERLTYDDVLNLLASLDRERRVTTLVSP